MTLLAIVRRVDIWLVRRAKQRTQREALRAAQSALNLRRGSGACPVFNRRP